jgi:Spy/CpxP family protein refolding chaperone
MEVLVRRAVLSGVLLLVLAQGCQGPNAASPGAPAPGASPRPPGQDPIGQKLFPPELIMGHQGELGLEDPQRDAIISEIEGAQGQLTRLQWQLQAAVEELSRLLGASRVEEAKALEQAAEVMRLEGEVKRTHLGLLIRIKNLLTEPQQKKLEEIRARSG